VRWFVFISLSLFHYAEIQTLLSKEIGFHCGAIFLLLLLISVRFSNSRDSRVPLVRVQYIGNTNGSKHR